MTLEQCREQEIERHKKNLESIDAIEEVIPESLKNIVQFVVKSDVFINPIKTIDKVYSCLRGCKYELVHYYMNGGDALAVVYAVSGVHFVFFVTEYEAALEVLSGGKCRIVKSTKEEVELSVSCEMEEH